MSAIEIIEEIKKLPSEEQQKIAVYISETTRPRTGVSEEFKRAADRIFTENAELFRKLAQ